MVVESSDSSLFLKRNLCLRDPRWPSARKRAVIAQNKSSKTVAGRCALAYERFDLLGLRLIPRWTSLPRQQARPLQISRRESAWAGAGAWSFGSDIPLVGSRSVSRTGRSLGTGTVVPGSYMTCFHPDDPHNNHIFGLHGGYRKLRIIR